MLNKSKILLLSIVFKLNFHLNAKIEKQNGVRGDTDHRADTDGDENLKLINLRVERMYISAYQVEFPPQTNKAAFFKLVWWILSPSK